jgi:hypothetical protein
VRAKHPFLFLLKAIFLLVEFGGTRGMLAHQMVHLQFVAFLVEALLDCLYDIRQLTSIVGAAEDELHVKSIMREGEGHVR